MKCFADGGLNCTALREKLCDGCNFFKTQCQFEDGEKINIKRVESLNSKIINIFK